MAGSQFILEPDEHNGRKLGKYEILCRLSTGGMSEIFLAFQKGLAGFRKFVVLKQILPDIKGEEEFVRMFLDEAKITAAFAHPNIAQVFDLDIAEGELFLAMEFVPGATLVEVARACRNNNEPIPIGFTLMAVRDTALALYYAHHFTDPMGRAQQVIHRDIAEKNIMVTYEGVTKLLDFGIAKALNRSSRTSVGMVKGTSGYMSPEQILGEPLDPRSDVFSLGVVLHECLTGMRLFHGKTAEQAMLQALKGEIAPPSANNKTVIPELDQVTLKALQRNRAERYGTALEFARAIEKVASAQIWHAEQSSEFIQRLFAQRRDQTRELMSAAQGNEHTGEFRIAEFLGNEPPRPPQPAPIPEPIPAAVPPPVPGRKASSAAHPVLEPLPRPPVKEREITDEIVLPEPIAPKPRRRTRSDLQRQKDPEPDTAPGRPASNAGFRAPPAPPPPPVGPDPRFVFRDEPEARTIPASSLPSELFDSVTGELRPSGPHQPWSDDHTVPRINDEISRSDLTVVSVEDPEITNTGVTPFPDRRKLKLGLVVGLVLALGIGFFVWSRAGGAQEPSRAELTEPAPEVADESEGKPPEALPEPAPPPKPAPKVVAPVEPEPAPPETPAAVAPKVEEKKVPPPPRKKERVRPARAVAPPAAPIAAAAPVADTRPSPEPAPVVEDGTLTLVTEPWSTVFLGGRELGVTPLVRVGLAPGKHNLRLVGPDQKAVVMAVEIAPGKETKVRVPLEMLKAAD
jgi:eukaryotic-like serine/threonine-protein kinase